MTLIFDLDQDRDKINQHANHKSKVIPFKSYHHACMHSHTHAHTHTHTHTYTHHRHHHYHQHNNNNKSSPKVIWEEHVATPCQRMHSPTACASCSLYNT